MGLVIGAFSFSFLLLVMFNVDMFSVVSDCLVACNCVVLKWFV